MVLRYRYAEDEASQLVDVQLLTRDTRHILGPYRCLSCGDRLIPALGEKVAHHFRHKTEQACNRETYLHRTAKLVFLEAFMAAVASGRPYLVHRPAPRSAAGTRPGSGRPARSGSGWSPSTSPAG